MEQLDQRVISAIVSGPEFTEVCSSGKHTATCSLIQQLTSNPDVEPAFSKAAGVHKIDPYMLAEFFAFGFILAREYYAIQRLESTVLNTVEKP